MSAVHWAWEKGMKELEFDADAVLWQALPVSHLDGLKGVLEDEFG